MPLEKSKNPLLTAKGYADFWAYKANEIVEIFGDSQADKYERVFETLANDGILRFIFQIKKLPKPKAPPPKATPSEPPLLAKKPAPPPESLAESPPQPQIERLFAYEPQTYLSLPLCADLLGFTRTQFLTVAKRNNIDLRPNPTSNGKYRKRKVHLCAQAGDLQTLLWNALRKANVEL